jgi:enamine deaminase RidA (YjgF/YER057c/UK114 family)
MERKNISSGGAFEAAFGYSRAVRVGDHIHVAGTCAQPPHDMGDAYEQAKGALGIIENALIQTGASLQNVVRTVVYITNTAHADGVTRAHGETFSSIMPASTMVVIAELLKPNLVVEIEAYAILT